jgi:hypothetical protein
MLFPLAKKKLISEKQFIVDQKDGQQPHTINV